MAREMIWLFMRRLGRGDELMNGYKTDITELTCSCLDWTEIRMEYSRNDPRRLCKHIINKLDINNLPNSIKKFKEDIEFYQEQEWGFKTDFEKVVELGSLTLLKSLDWTDVFENGIRYGVKKEDFSDNIYWANNLKPKEYELVEIFLFEESKKIPLPLEQEEYPQIIDFIKNVLPCKKDSHISISESMYAPSCKGVIYDIHESKYTPAQEKKLEEELLQKYEEKEAYRRLFEAISTPLGEEDEFSIYEALTVTNNEIIVGMDGGKKYKLARNYEQIKLLSEMRELKKKEQEKEQQEARERYEQERQKKLEKDRKTAQGKGYILSKDYTGSLYEQESLSNFVSSLAWDEYPWEEYYNNKNFIFDQYDSLKNLLQTKADNIKSVRFNRVLKELNFIVKDPSLNRNKWILIEDGLYYGLNVPYDSKYMHEKIPYWYEVHIFNSLKCDFNKIETTSNIKMTNILFLKNKFDKLYQIVQEYIKNEG